MRLQFIKGDIQSMDLLSFVLLTEKIDTIMHFAAQVWAHLCFSAKIWIAMHVVHWQPWQ